MRVVLGLGRTGIAAARFLLRQKEKVLAMDDYLEEEHIPQDIKEDERFEFCSPADFLMKADFPSISEVITSPGIPLTHPVLRASKERKIPVISEIELATRFISFPLIGVTGSCGKSTTVFWTKQILERAGWSVFLGGNWGCPLIESLSAPEKFDWGVVELSSFQLAHIDKARFSVAVVLNLFPNHLDYHSTTENYFWAKARILENQKRTDFAVINFSSSCWSARFSRLVESQLIPVARDKKLSEGFYIWDNKVFRGKEPLFSLSHFSLPGKHQQENLLVALSIALLAGVEKKVAEEAIASLSSLPHRLEKVGSWGGIDYFNDSKSTTPSSTRVAVESLSCPVILILGGKAKIDDFSELTTTFQSGKVKAVVVYGESRNLIEKFIPPHLERHLVFSLEEAVKKAKSLAGEGDAVLLSPACTSWDQYRSFEERGEHFRQLVYELERSGISRY
ncbi:MAG TPA: UDP-N-acetylmuramoyl-L-alanine--D-glutamate ligase [Candidatus Atribacteria bacterium]|nr:UDP-N-acetylmuramoyl-L-alanine--D-glutamate ligase [Candidatus Atribacteria bacterium]